VIDDRNVEAMYVMIDDSGDSYVVYARVRIMGHDMLVAEYGMPVRAWAKHKSQQIFAMRSFKFLKDSNTTIEERVERKYFESVQLFYPKSWLFLGEEVPQDNQIIIGLGVLNKTKTDAGRIRIAVIGEKSLKDARDPRIFVVDAPAYLRDLRATYENKGFVIGESIDSGKPDLNLPVTFSARDVYELRRKGTQYDTDKVEPITDELWVAVFKSGNKTYVAELFTPSRKQNIYQWAVNTRAFEIILKSIQ
jgi:hypothetical protein